MSVATQIISGLTTAGSGCNSSAWGLPSFAKPLRIDPRYMASSTPTRRPYRRNTRTSSKPFSSNSGSDTSSQNDESRNATTIPLTPRQSWPRRSMSSLKRTISQSNLVGSSKPWTTRYEAPSKRYAKMSLPSDVRSELEISEALMHSLGVNTQSDVLSDICENLAALSQDPDNSCIYEEFVGGDSQSLFEQINLWQRLEDQRSKSKVSKTSETSVESEPWDPRILAKDDEGLDVVPTETDFDFIVDKEGCSDSLDPEHMMSGGLGSES